ncbi:hypothetical protein HXX76_008609 [Chlamydomonas incerta]|uniref:Uncharacterized protein n=1 Tax=Chlamydomonas incerta TaxID=51695 RepID=A0A835ST50_CHLIN|nr:hypothetical protein HXX76_008609 [Chlamydomonas incerta]|eukprot:KAG2432877.1 hypothetical protein HXX76_008609 [Chlamydomonas incerta]
MFPKPGERVHDRQRGRINALRQLDEATAREAEEKRLRLQRRVARRAFEHQVMIETIELEKELEARRCKLCDLLRAEAWGLGHPNWTERRCGQCWVELADHISRERHGPAAAAPAAPPLASTGRPRPGVRQQLPAHSRLHTSPPRAPTGGPRAAGAARTGVAAAEPEAAAAAAAELFRDVPVDQVDQVVEALRAKDTDRLMQLLDDRALQRHFGPHQEQQQGQGRARIPNPRAAAPHPDAPLGRGGLFYHDDVLQGLSEEAEREAAGSSEGEGSARSVASSAVADAGGRWESGGGSRSPGRRAGRSPGDAGTRGRGSGSGSGEDTDDEAEAAARSGRGAEDSAEEEQAGSASEISLAQQPAADAAAVGPHEQVLEAPGDEARGAAPGAAPKKTVRLAVAGHRPAPRPLPSKPKAVPTGRAEMHKALKQAEQMVVFGQTQHDRSTALFYSHQLRAALADLARLERRGRKSAAVHRHGVRLDTRDDDGIKRIIREDRPERAPSPTTLRRWTDPDSFYTDPPKRTPRWLEHVHPDKTNPSRQADAVPWRPASAKPPAPRHTAGMQSVGDWSEYKYEWDLAQVRSMQVDDYLSSLRKRREYRSALAGLQARVLAQLPPDARDFPNRYSQQQQQAGGLQQSFVSQAQGG